MNNQKDSVYFDDSKLQAELKQTATFFNPMNSLGQSIRNPINQSHRAIMKPPLELTFKPASDSKKYSQQQKNEQSFQQTIGKRGSASLKNITKVQVKSTQQLQKNVPQPQISKINSPMKLQKTPSIKPFSPPQPRALPEVSPMHYNASLLQISQNQQQERRSDKKDMITNQIVNKDQYVQHFKELDKRQILQFEKQSKQYVALPHDDRIKFLQQKLKQSRVGNNSDGITEDQFPPGDVSMSDLTPYQDNGIHQTGKPTSSNLNSVRLFKNETQKRLTSVQDSYQPPVQMSNKQQQELNNQAYATGTKITNYNSSFKQATFLPKIVPSYKLLNINNNVNNTNGIYGYGSVGQSQETGLRSSSSKQTISPNEFISNNNQQQQEDSQLRKSKTAQETIRDAQFQFGQKQQNKNEEILPQIPSPQAGANTGYDFNGQNKKKSFLLRKPQLKIVSRLFSSKSDNN